MDQADGDGVVRAIGMVSSEGEEVAFLGAHSPGAQGPHDVSVACVGGAEEWLAQVERAMCNTVREGTWAQAVMCGFRCQFSGVTLGLPTLRSGRLHPVPSNQQYHSDCGRNAVGASADGVGSSGSGVGGTGGTGVGGHCAGTQTSPNTSAGKPSIRAQQHTAADCFGVAGEAVTHFGELLHVPSSVRAWAPHTGAFLADHISCYQSGALPRCCDSTRIVASRVSVRFRVGVASAPCLGAR